MFSFWERESNVLVIKRSELSLTVIIGYRFLQVALSQSNLMPSIGFLSITENTKFPFSYKRGKSTLIK
jgi:hypothetical protein